MYRYDFREWLAFFDFYCFFGWCFESAYVSLKSRRPVNRGFLKGPWLPLYGSGAILVLFLTLPVKDSPVLVFLTGALGATALELVTGEAMVRLFRVRYWDYSGQRFQYRGHICLGSSIAWGFLSILMVYGAHRPVERLLFAIPGKATAVLTFLTAVCMALDFAHAFRKAMDLRALLIQAERLKAELEERAQERKRLLEATAVFAKAAMEESISESAEELGERLDRLWDRIAEKSESLLMQSPRARFATLPDAARIRERIRLRREKRKKKR